MKKCDLRSSNCTSNAFRNIFTVDNYIRDKCAPLCPLECNTTEYKTTLTSNRLIGDIFVGHLQKNSNLSSDFIGKPVNAQQAGDSIVSMDIYYDSLSYTLSTESAKLDIVSLLASIGGNMGLFMGISMLSVCELVEILIEIYLQKKKERSLTVE